MTKKNFFSGKRIVVFLVMLGLFFSAFNFVFAKENIEINFFYGQSCPNCAKEKIFLEKIENEYPDIKINRFEGNKNVELLKKLYTEYQVPKKVWGWVPITFIEDKYFLGYDNDELKGKEIEGYILELMGNPPSPPIIKPTASNGDSPPPVTKPTIPIINSGDKEIKLPLIGTVSISGFSPLALAIILGIFDGFNACAMTALAFLLAILISTGIRKKIFFIGGTFILVSGFVYFLFISALLNLFLIMPYQGIITLIVGLIIITFSIFILKDYFKGVICKLCEIKPGSKNIFTKFQRGLFRRMEEIIAAKKSLVLTLLGVAVVAAGVNLVELACSFGIPLAFTDILATQNLATSSYYFYLLVYIIFYMLDDFLIFLVAVWTLKMTQFSQKYLRVIKLISGILLLALGLIMLFKPELLAFSFS